MSTSRAQSPEHAKENTIGTSSPLPPELALRPSRDVPSDSLPDLGVTASPARTTLSQSLFPQPTTPTISSLSSSGPPSSLRSQSQDRSPVGGRRISNSVPLNDANQGNRQIIVRSFAPRVAVYASTETEEFVRNKGFKDGLCGLLKPYGEQLQGKVIIRDSIGSSKAWDDFGIRFVNPQHLQQFSTNRPFGEGTNQESQGFVNGFQNSSEYNNIVQSGESDIAIDQLLDHEGSWFDSKREFYECDFEFDQPGPNSAHLHGMYLRKILSNASLVPYETFAHPVACVIAVSSRQSAPIEALRQLYGSTSHRGNKTPAWIGTEYLRYYILIHDEENDEITKSTALFDLMKRHFGLHCHLLRLRSSQCIETDDDSTRVPLCEWGTAEEEMHEIRARDYTEDLEISDDYILESDATAIKACLREMVTQSIVPFMENRVMTWNDQVASRRRGIGGRFISLSKRWTGFGSAKNAVSGSSGAPNASGNYDHERGYYSPDSPEATMRQLGDYAFMLRDWKLAYSMYDLLRADFGHDKAWSYHAAANEMAALTSLITLQTYNSRSRSESVDHLLDTAVYSYLTRCSMPSNVVRCLTLATELLRSKGSIAVDDAARWGGRLLELGVLTPFAQALATERIADSYACQSDPPSPIASSRARQSAFWNVLASGTWSRLDKSALAEQRLRAAKAIYYRCNKQTSGLPFRSMQPLWQNLERAIGNAGPGAPLALVDVGTNEPGLDISTVEESEQLGQPGVFAHPADVNDDIDREGFTIQDSGYSNTHNS